MAPAFPGQDRHVREPTGRRGPARARRVGLAAQRHMNEVHGRRSDRRPGRLPSSPHFVSMSPPLYRSCYIDPGLAMESLLPAPASSTRGRGRDFVFCAGAPSITASSTVVASSLPLHDQPCPSSSTPSLVRIFSSTWPTSSCPRSRARQSSPTGRVRRPTRSEPSLVCPRLEPIPLRPLAGLLESGIP